jgi:multiple sugar transport system substrate-binding protein
VTVLLVAPLAACQSEDEPEPTPTPSLTPSATAPSAPTEATRLTFGAFGAEDELAAYEAVTGSYDALEGDVDVRLRTAPDADALAESLRDGEPAPDVFMVSRADMSWLLEEGLTQPVDTLLDERGVDFGDDYSRDGLEAFSIDDRLQCMPYGLSPTVMFYNRELVDFERMAERELPVPGGEEPLTWSYEAFTAAAEYASRPRRNTRGVHVGPRLEELAPFVHTGGGQVFDDVEDPTSLAFSSDETRDALEASLPVLRDPLVTLAPEMLARRSPLEWFERGKLAMLPGRRDLVPRLRQVPGLDFDVIAMPSIDGQATVGDVTGLCLSAEAVDTPAAADLMVHLLSTPSVQRVVNAGYLVPANQEVALSDDFLQPGRAPRHAQVFTSTVRHMELAPLIDDWDALQAAAAPGLQRLLNEPVLDDLDEITEQIDEASREVLSPESESASPEE